MTQNGEENMEANSEVAAVTAELFSDYSNLSESDTHLPTVRLSGTNEVIESNGIIGEVSEEELPTYMPSVTAEHIVGSVRDVDVEGGRSTRAFHPSHKRAEFISVTFYKDAVASPIGVVLQHSPTTKQVRLHSIHPGTPAERSPLKPGDIILSVNSKNCSDLNGNEVGTLIRTAYGKLTIIAHNEDGDSNLVESMVAKPSLIRNKKWGISLKNINNKIVIAKITSHGLLCDSLVNEGDELMLINETPCIQMSAMDAASMIRYSHNQVTLLTKTTRETAVVLAEISSRHLRASSRSIILPLSRPAAAGQANDETTEERQKRETLCFLCGIVVVGVVLMAIFLSGTADRNGSTDY
jgi:hypothetical protein